MGEVLNDLRRDLFPGAQLCSPSRSGNSVIDPQRAILAPNQLKGWHAVQRVSMLGNLPGKLAWVCSLRATGRNVQFSRIDLNDPRRRPGGLRRTTVILHQHPRIPDRIAFTGLCRGMLTTRVPSVLMRCLPRRATRKPIFSSARTASRWLTPGNLGMATPRPRPAWPPPIEQVPGSRRGTRG